MFDFTGGVNVLPILDPIAYPGAEYFNWFFTLVLVFGLISFGIKALVRVLTRS